RMNAVGGGLGARRLRSVLLGGAAVMALGSAPALAQNIDTISSWNGTSFISSWGIPNTPTYGQTITANGVQNKLTSFTFELAQQAGTPPNYQAFVYQWDAANQRITGSALFTSAPLVAPTTANANTYVPVKVNTGTLNLTPGQQYVLFF